MTREDILTQANKCVNGERDQQYGNPENNFKLIASLWNAYIYGASDTVNKIGFALEPKDVAAMLGLLKIARIATGQPKPDNWIDLAGYAACGGEIDSKNHSK
jgi:hypothetical protein